MDEKLSPSGADSDDNSVSSDETFRSAISSVPHSALFDPSSPTSPTSPLAPSSPSPSSPTPSSPPPLSSTLTQPVKSSTRSRWFFKSSTSIPPASSSPKPQYPPSSSKPPSKRPRPKPDRRTRLAPQLPEPRRSLPPPHSDRSSRSSADDRRSSRQPDAESHNSLRLTTRASPTSTVAPPTPAPPTPSSTADTSDDWALEELPARSSDVPLASAFSYPFTASSDNPSTHSDDPIPHARSSTTPPASHRDTLTLRAFDETPQRRSSAHPDIAPTTAVVGVYADPAAETDDWGDDFDIDDEAFAPRSTSFGVDDNAFVFPPGTDELDQFSADAQPSRTSIAQPSQPDVRPLLSPAAAEVAQHPEDALPVRSPPLGSFSTPQLTHSSLLMYPGMGYPTSAVHPSCTAVKSLFATHGATIRRHFDALVRDSGGTIAFEERTRRHYLLSFDADVFALAPSHAELGPDLLAWKLDLATVNDNQPERARSLLAIARLNKESSNLSAALARIQEAITALQTSPKSALVLALGTEAEYESAILHRAFGALAEAGRALKRAMERSAALAAGEYRTDETFHDVLSIGLDGARQRGVWWQLRCKFLRADMAYDVDEKDTAVQFYSEYIIEAVSRMIGEVEPPDLPLPTDIPEYMRFCVLSPRRLVLALWTSVLCLGGLRCFAVAADLAGITALVASSFGYEDAGEAAAQVRARIKVIGDELTSQYEDISRSILQNDDSEHDELHGGSVQNMPDITGKPIEYSGGDFGDVTDEVVEDWDAQLERELNIRIERCNDLEAEQDLSDELSPGNAFGNGVAPTSSDDTLTLNAPDHPGFINHPGNNSKNAKGLLGKTKDHIVAKKWTSGGQEGQLIEAELKQYLSRLAAVTMGNLTVQQMYPKPTEPFDGQLLAPQDHEVFLRNFVRSKDPDFAKKLLHGFPMSYEWHPSAVCKLNFNIEPIEEIDAFNYGTHSLTAELGVRFFEAIWKVVRSQVPAVTKQSRLRRLMLNALSKIAATSRRTPVQDASDRLGRLEMLGAILDALRVAREMVTDSGKEAVWFSRACMSLGIAASTVSPSAKAAVELLQAENRAHCGVRAVISPVMLERCERAARAAHDREVGVFATGASPGHKSKHSSEDDIPAQLRQTVVDLMHGLYWRTKAGFDESSRTDSLERLLHADVASSLFLTGSGISPVDGTKIELSDEIRILRIPKKMPKSLQANSFVDETRRVSASELVYELQKLWTVLPLSAGVVRAKVAFALAHHSKVTLHNHARAERYLFDGLRSVYSVSSDQTFPNSFFSRSLLVSPVSLISSPLIGAILNMYGSLTIAHSKYRYGVAALESACDAVRVRNMDKQSYRASVFHVVDIALKNNDWRRALTLLDALKLHIHPKNGLRNEFIFLCVKLHKICFDVGCLDASIVPLRAYSSLIFEERLRVLLQRYKRRLAKKSRSRFRRYITASNIPKLLPGSSLFNSRKNTLASFFEIPAVPGRTDFIINRKTTAVPEDGPSRLSTVVLATSAPSQNAALGALISLLWPLQLLFSQYRPDNEHNGAARNQARATPDVVTEDSSKEAKKSSPVANPTRNQRKYKPVPDTEHEQEERELFRIEAEQEVTADSDRCHVELLRAETDYARANYHGAEERCVGLLAMSIPATSRFKVCEILARIRLKRMEITRCLEQIDQMEREHQLAALDRSPSRVDLTGLDNGQGAFDDVHSLSDDFREDPRMFGDNQDAIRKSFFRKHDFEKNMRVDERANTFVPQITFLRLRALTHGGRLDEALHLADKALESCSDASFWDKGRLHYLRGKVLYAMSNTSTPSFREEDNVNFGGSESSAELTIKVTELTLAAFETASHFYYAAGDEVCTSKSDLMWARTCIDFLFRRVVLKPTAGGGTPVHEICQLPNQKIVLAELQEVVYNVLSLASNANIPLLLMDAMAALAEVKCIRGQPASSWSSWVTESWKLFSRLYIEPESFKVVLQSLAPVSFLIRLKNVCGRLVRLVMCHEHVVPVVDMNRHLRLFEAYVTLQLTIDQKMNLASGDRSNPVGFETSFEQSESSIPKQRDTNESSDIGEHSPPNLSKKKLTDFSIGTNSKLGGDEYSKTSQAQHQNVPSRETKPDNLSDATSEFSAQSRPAGAFLHMIGNEGIALGRQGFSLFINRPRKQVISAVRGTGAVLIPSNFFSNSRATPGFQSHRLGKDAEMIYPFKPSLGLGAVEILSDENEAEDTSLNLNMYAVPGTDLPLETLLKNAVAEDDSETHTRSDDEENVSQSRYEVRQNSPASSIMDERRSQETEPAAKDTSSSAPHLGQPNSGLSEAGVDCKPGSESRGPSERLPSHRDSGPSELSLLFNAVLEELQHGRSRTKGSSSIFGQTSAARVWAHHHRIKSASKRYMHGEITLEQLHERNGDALLSWVHCTPISDKQWIVPESIGRRLVYILYAHGVVGYYAVERGGSIERLSFGGKEETFCSSELINGTPGLNKSTPTPTSSAKRPRPPSNVEQLYLFEMVRSFKRDGVWHKNRDSEIVSGLANAVLKAPRLLLSTSSPAQKSRGRPIVLIADMSMQVIPWELFFEHVVIRSHCLLHVIRGSQDEISHSSSSLVASDDPTAASRRIVRFINFIPSRKEVTDLERTEEQRRQQLAFQGLLRLQQMTAASLIPFLGFGGFSDTTAVNAVARPIGPLSSPLSQSRKAVQLFGLRIAANIGKRNYPHLDFVKMAGLGSASTEDLKEAALSLQPNITEGGHRHGYATFVPVFMFSYADLVDCSKSIFGLQNAMPRSILLFTPAVHMKVLARHLEDDELSVELKRASGRFNNWTVQDMVSAARILVEHVSRFSRDKRIPIVVFLGEKLFDVFPKKKVTKHDAARQEAPVAERIAQLASAGRGGILPKRE